MNRKKFENHSLTPVILEPLSTATIHGHVRTLRAFFLWLVLEGLLERNPAKGLKPPKIEKKGVSTLSDQEMKNILDSFNPTLPSDARNQTIFMLMIDTGMRVKELVNLKFEDIQMDEGLIKVMGKGKRERIVPFGSKVQRSLQRYSFRYRLKPVHQDINNVFLSVTGSPVTESSIKLVFARLAKRTGVHRLHAHLCRHTFATRFLINGGDVFSLQ